MSYLSVSRNQILRRNARQANQECESLHGTIKLTGVATYAIENCGDCDCTLLIKKLEDGSFHQPYDEGGWITDETQLTNEVCELFEKTKQTAKLCLLCLQKFASDLSCH